MKISLLINMKMPTAVGIFMFISREKFHAQLSWAWKKFYNLGAWSESPFSECNTKTKQKKKHNCILGSPVKILIELHECATWFESSLGAHVRRHVFLTLLLTYLQTWKAQIRLRGGWYEPFCETNYCAFRHLSESRFFARRFTHITKTCLFEYTENFTSRNWKLSDTKIFFIFLLKIRLWILVRTASTRRF